MAFSKKIEQPSGVTAEYWKLRAVHLDFNSETMLIEVEGYLNAKAREEGKSPIVPLQQINVSGVTDDMKDSILKLLYPVAAEKIEFLKDAKNV